MLLSSLNSLTRITLPADRGTRSTCIPVFSSRNHDVRPTHWLPPQNRVSARHGVSARASSVAATPSLNADDGAEREIKEGVFEGTWLWKQNGAEYRIRYQRCGETGPPALLVHGFGGNCDHWRKNIPVLGQQNRVFAIDLLGYGYSDKPSPRSSAVNSVYCFEVWGQQLLDFISEKIGEPTFIITNSVGGLAGLAAAIQEPASVPGVMLTNISLRMLHADKQSRFQRPLVAWLQRTLRETTIGQSFFGSVAKPETVKRILKECYGNPDAVTDELVDKILTPGLRPGAADVFLDFLSYSSGPLPEQQLEEVTVPVSILWGDKDPWEKVEWGREFKKYASVEEFIELEGVGHCPMDEAPHLVNPLVQKFIERHTVNLVPV